MMYAALFSLSTPTINLILRIFQKIRITDYYLKAFLFMYCFVYTAQKSFLRINLIIRIFSKKWITRASVSSRKEKYASNLHFLI